MLDSSFHPFDGVEHSCFIFGYFQGLPRVTIRMKKSRELAWVGPFNGCEGPMSQWFVIHVRYGERRIAHRNDDIPTLCIRGLAPQASSLQSLKFPECCHTICPCCGLGPIDSKLARHAAKRQTALPKNAIITEQFRVAV